MKFKKWPIHIWFLDDDLQKSAEYLTDYALQKTVNGCIGALASTYMYFIGIRSKKFFSHYFSKENVSSTMASIFSGWPGKKKPTFTAYNWRESKWCRSCHENFSYICQYLSILIDECQYRSKDLHGQDAMLQWLENAVRNVDFPYAGIDKIHLPWKCIDPKYRRVDIVAGYRLQFMSMFEDNDPFKAYGACIRDIPQFVLDYFNANAIHES